MSRTIKLDIGINGAFLTRRWEQPENWMRLTAELGYPYHSFCGDVLDPFFSGDLSFLKEQAAETRTAAEKYGVKFCDIYTGVATHRFHGLSHSDPRARRRMAEWIEQCADLANWMGVDAIGGHWDAFSVEVLEDPKLTAEATTRLYQTFRELAVMLKKKGIRALYQEQMYIPSEKPWLLSEADEFLVEVNRDNPGVPVYLTLDVGHMAGMHYGATGDDLNYVTWLERFSSAAEVIHLQQTTADGSHHWPFLPEYNAKGVVEIPRVLDAIAESHRKHAERPYAFMEPVSTHYLVSEIIPGSTKTETKLLDELKRNAEYLREFIPVGGLTIEV